MIRQIPYAEPVLFIYALILFIDVPLEKQMIYNKVCLNHYNQSFCSIIRLPFLNHSYEENLVQKETAQWDMYNNVIRTIPTIISTVFLGALSDGVGRKKVLLVPVMGACVNSISYFLNAWYFSAPVPFIFIGSLISGISGNFPAMMMSVLAYVSDVTQEESRTIRLIIVESSVFLASIISLFAAGVILLRHGFVAVYALDIALALLMLLFALLLKESYHPTKLISLKEAFCGYKVTESFKVFSLQRYEDHRGKFCLLVGCFCFLFFINMGVSEILILYLLHTPLHFLPTTIGYVLASESSVKFVGSFLVSTLLVRRFKWQDSSLILLCSISMSAYATCLGLSHENTKVYLSTLWGFGTCAGVAACRSGLTKMVSVEEQGKLNSVVCTLQEICLLLVAIICNSIYKATVHITPGFTLYFLAGVGTIPIVLSIMMKFWN